ncbi:DUF4961 domain-containing protein [Sediminitomix flava]|uniref:Putative secreted protein (Por secretion system target) n=1 Tax=Sediminitomix flava TaxID=379075 RepID=A0A315ZYP1_SEDFL|nr:alpha-amylase family glycosyl hydrolase [Sediminitomix flava]PWJ42487.1 putative secreted protein (Por secretion system target) [Sediminitomix flava]
MKMRKKILSLGSGVLYGLNGHNNGHTFKKHLLCLFGMLLVSNFSFAQTITASVDPIIADQPVTFTADLSNSDLNLNEAWAWVWVEQPQNSSASVPTNVNPADASADDAKWTNTSGDLWELTFTPTEFMNVPVSEIEELGILLKGKDWGDGQTGDFKFKVIPSEGSLQITLNSPTQTDLNSVQIEDDVVFDLTTNKVADLSVVVNGDTLIQETGEALAYTWTVTTGGLLEIEVLASAEEDGKTETDRKELKVFIEPNVVAKQRPAYATNFGPNYNGTEVTLVMHDPKKLKKNVYAIGDFSDWKTDQDFLMYKDEEAYGNYWWITISDLDPDKEYIYQYLIDGEIKIADPYTEKVSDYDDKYINQGIVRYPDLIAYPEGKTSFRASVFQINQPTYEWEVTDFERPAQEDLVVYEMHIRDFTEEDTYQASIERLDYIQELGANCIHLMPINEFEGNDSWGYNPNFYFAPDKYYGTKNDLKQFIDESHKRGIAVIIDMVLNHSYHSSPLVRMYNDGDFGDPTSDNPWYNVESPNNEYFWGADLNHESIHTQTLVDSVNLHWVKHYNIDGYRFDFTKGFTQTPGPGHGYDAARIVLLNRMANELWKNEEAEGAYVILEHLADNQEEKELAANDIILWGNINHNFRGTGNGGTDDLGWQYHKNRGYEKMGVMSYMESHDEERLVYDALNYGASEGTYNLQELPNALERQKLNAAFFFTVPGPKLIWQFGELGYDYSINYNDRVGRKPVRWDYAENPLRFNLYKTYQALISLRNQLQISSYSYESVNLGGATKEVSIETPVAKMYAIGNFSITEKEVTIKFPNTGTWYNYFTGEEINVTEANQTVTFAPSEFRIFVDQQMDFPEEGIVKAYTPMVQVNPFEFDEDTEIKIIFDPAEGNAALLGEEKVYVQAGLILEDIGSEKVEKLTRSEMTKVEDKWELTMTPRAYFELTASEKPFHFVLYFENESGDKKGLTLEEKEVVLDFKQNIEDGKIVFSPANWLPSEEVTITINVSGTSLEGDQDAYLWAWIDPSSVSSDIDNGAWENSSEGAKMVRVSSTKVKITMTPTSYYGASSADIFANGIKFLIKTKDGGSQTADMGPFKPNVTTGVEDDYKSQSMYLAPNPATGSVEIGFKDQITEPVAVDFFNIQGQHIFSGLYRASDSKIALDISNLTSGIYVVRTVSNLGVQTQKLVVR